MLEPVHWAEDVAETDEQIGRHGGADWIQGDVVESRRAKVPGEAWVRQQLDSFGSVGASLSKRLFARQTDVSIGRHYEGNIDRIETIIRCFYSEKERRALRKQDKVGTGDSTTHEGDCSS